ncbi:MAG: dual specificity protein phosphatase family protein [Bryobacterales bacterium]|nr:dual specificity protein phosphatase family protein [Bryobacterales bacterium]
MRPQLFWIPGPWLGRLAVAARPRGGDWLDDEMDGWAGSGTGLIVSLLEPNEEEQLGLTAEASAARARNMKFTSFPIPDRDTPSSLRDTLALLADIEAALRSGINVAVHCRQGVGRSGLIAAGVLITSGMSPNDAVRIVSAARGVTVPETEEQVAWIRNLGAAQRIPA